MEVLIPTPNRRHQIRKTNNDPDPDYSPFSSLERLYYELKPLLILGIAYKVSHTKFIHVPLAKFSVILLLTSAAIIIYYRLEYRGYLKR